jgi:Tfp pilus assembly protein PilV
MRKEMSHIKKQENMHTGFTLIEVIVSAGLVILFATLFIGALSYGEESTQIAGQHNRATFLAEEGIEAARNIRDQSFADLVNGTFGVSTSTGVWTLSGVSDTQDIFTRTVTMATVDAVTKQITSTVTWPENALRTGTVSVVTYLTNTQLLATQANSLSVAVSGAKTSANNVIGITVQNIGSSTITIDKITASWSPTARVLQAIQINAVSVWTGSASSGTQEDITNVVMAAGSGVMPVTKFQFNGSMTGNTLTLVFLMTDGSTKTVTTPSL